MVIGASSTHFMAPLGSVIPLSLRAHRCKIMLQTICISIIDLPFMHFLIFWVGLKNSSLGPKGPFFCWVRLVSPPGIMARGIGPLLALAVVGCGLRALSWVPVVPAPRASASASVVSRCAQATFLGMEHGDSPMVKFTGPKVYQSCVFGSFFLNEHISICGLQIVELMLIDLNRYLLVLENSLVEGLVLISGMKLNFRRWTLPVPDPQQKNTSVVSHQPKNHENRCQGLDAVDPGNCKDVRSNAVNGVRLPVMDEDEPAWLSFVIARYLDEDRMWMDGVGVDMDVSENSGTPKTPQSDHF